MKVALEGSTLVLVPINRSEEDILLTIGRYISDKDVSCLVDDFIVELVVRQETASPYMPIQLMFYRQPKSHKE